MILLNLQPLRCEENNSNSVNMEMSRCVILDVWADWLGKCNSYKGEFLLIPFKRYLVGVSGILNNFIRLFIIKGIDIDRFLVDVETCLAQFSLSQPSVYCCWATQLT